MPIWIADEYKKNIFYPIIFLILTLSLLFLSTQYFLSSKGILPILFLFTSFLLTIYFSGRFYCEIKAHKDFIDISTQGLRFRETPGLSVGWLPINDSIKFEDIKKSDMIKIKNIFNPTRESLAIYLIPVEGKPIILGTKLNEKQIMKIGIALKGSVVISNALQRFIGDETQVKDILDTAKGIWKNITNKEE